MATDGVLAASNKLVPKAKAWHKPLSDRMYIGRIAKAKYEFVRIDEVEKKVKEALCSTLGPECALVVMKKMSTTFDVPLFDQKEAGDDKCAARKLHKFVAGWHPSKPAIVKLALGALTSAAELLEDGRPLLIRSAGSLE